MDYPCARAARLTVSAPIFSISKETRISLFANALSASLTAVSTHVCFFRPGDRQDNQSGGCWRARHRCGTPAWSMCLSCVAWCSFNIPCPTQRATKVNERQGGREVAFYWNEMLFVCQGIFYQGCKNKINPTWHL